MSAPLTNRMINRLCRSYTLLKLKHMLMHVFKLLARF